MKFLCDVHISYKLSVYLKSLGFEAVHVNRILNGSKTKDAEICAYADREDFIVISKDADFRDSFFIHSTPKKLVKVNLGNISNEQLKEIFGSLIETLVKLNRKQNFLLVIDRDEVSWFESE